jgi:hypothetical protein
MTTLACSLKARGHDPGVIFGLKANLGDICGNWDKKKPASLNLAFFWPELHSIWCSPL